MRRESSAWCMPAHISLAMLARKRAHLLARFRHRDNECRVESEEIFRGTKAPKGLSRCCGLRRGELVVDSNRHSGISVLRNSELGSTAGCPGALSWIPHCGHFGVDFRSYPARYSKD